VEHNEHFKHEVERFKYVDEGVEVLPYDTREPLRMECEHFIESILNKKTPKSGYENSLRVLKTLLASQQSIEKQGEAIKW
jgi:UDP-2-acetamido-3-amino-2,3-dideoxy-glucuronate N-acetyltransferase